MNQEERRSYLIKTLLDEQFPGKGFEIPEDENKQKKLLRSLVNIREPGEISKKFLEVEDEYLKEELKARGVTKLKDIPEVGENTYLFQGDITTLEVDAIVNAANSGMTGCYVPCHSCIDNAIHTYSGVRLRNTCAELIKAQGCPEKTGSAKITPAYNLPAGHVIHTVGPIVKGSLTLEDERLLASCYESSLKLADENGLESIAFCCISTGEFHFPNERAAEIAVETVKTYREKTGSQIKVIYNVFKDEDKEIYERLLG